MFQSAARTQASFVSDDRIAQGALFPDRSEWRAISRAIACGVIREARYMHVDRLLPDHDVEAIVDESMWYPDYVEYDYAS